MLIVICACVSTSIGTSSYAEASKNAVNEGVIEHPYLSIQVMNDNKPVMLRLGMTKQQIDRLLGEPVESESTYFKGYAYGKTYVVFVGYLNGRAASISATGYEISLNGQFKFGTPWQKVMDKIGQPTQKTSGSREYVFQLASGKLKQLYGKAIQGAASSRADIYTLRVFIRSSGNVSGFEVVQAAFTQAMEDRLTKPDPTRPIFSEADITGIKSGDDKRISLGMTREEVEKRCGKPDGHLYYSSVIMDAYDTVSVYYRKDVVAAILVDPSTNPQTATNRGLSMPADRTAVVRAYGQPTSSEPSGLDYNFEWIGGGLQAMSMYKAFDQRFWHNERFALSFIAYESNPDRIEYFILSDHDFRYDEYNIPKPVN
ncbi:hypothetical protein [Paenibacillus sacheonensis]|uniref:Uncharacterized protein n=1 Tax=Paenibacillus sacheonensis TaxID=742054 RepID=A0A7X5BXA5_9BACL|nr:hypothetical protein [Paenibacillus sacheonensis]MBM7564948.1 hypothetical protein [Paenibacillus sacheonensis]NBC70263.1 hypothetical protein [Paenibacillus sacheonensis]